MPRRAYSGHVLPKPADWGDDVLVSGYWFVSPPDWEMPSDLKAFLARGDAPVYVGFGSMPGYDPDWTTQVVVDALKWTGKRGPEKEVLRREAERCIGGDGRRGDAPTRGGNR